MNDHSLRAVPDLVELLEHRALDSGESAAFTFLSDGELAAEDLTYGELRRRALSIAVSLQSRVQPGARVLLLYPPGLEYICAFFGCLYGGFVAVPAYPPSPSKLRRMLPRLRAIVNDAAAEVILTTSSILGMTKAIAEIAPELGCKAWLATDRLEPKSDAAWKRPQLAPDTLAFLQYTSGSTGDPKGVMLSHENLLANQYMIRETFGLSSRSVGVGWLPLYHDMGLIGNVIQPIHTGFRCILMSPIHFFVRPRRWLEAISRYRATASGGPNFAYDLCARKISPQERKGLDLRSWKVAFSGAEPVRAETLERFANAFGDCGFVRRAFLPCFGLAEASLLVSGKPAASDLRVTQFDARALEEGRAVAPASADASRALVGAGRAAAGGRVLIVDPVTHRPLAEACVGEVWVAGPHVALGYWADPEKSAATFGVPLAGAGGERALESERFLRTGDLGFAKEGELYICGRLKDLIIVRGRNYYPQDFEQIAEDAHAKVRRGCAAAFSVEVEGEERIVVAAELEPGAQAQADEILAAVQRAVVETFDIDLHAVALLPAGAIPKTSSGKIQRYQCRRMFLEGSLKIVRRSAEPDTPPLQQPAAAADILLAPPAERLSLIETAIQGELAHRLRMTPGEIDLSSPLDALGLDSLTAVEIAQRLAGHFRVRLPVTALLGGDSAKGLAAKILAALPSSAASAFPPAQRDASERGLFPLSAGQEAMWFLQQLAPQSSAYNLATAFRVSGALSAQALESALRSLIARHPALHTGYVTVDGRPMQRLRHELIHEFGLEVVDASSLTDEQQLERAREAAERPFDLFAGPVLRARLLVRSPDEATLVVAVHHIAADLWSIVLLLGELREAYPAARAGRGSASPAAARASYADFVDWQKEYLQREGEADGAYWRTQLADADPLELPTDRRRPAVQTYRGAVHRARMDAALVARVKAFARREGVTPYVVLLAAFQVLLARYSGQRSFLVGSPATGRPAASYERTFGYFVNPLPLRADLAADPSVRELLRRVRETILAGLDHQSFPFPLMVQHSQGARDSSRSPLFQAAFVLEQPHVAQQADLTMLALGAADAAVEFAGLQLRPSPLPRTSAQFDLTLNIAYAQDQMGASFEYNTDLFDAATIGRMAAHFEVLLSGLLERPTEKVFDLPILLPDEEARALGEGGATGEFPSADCLHERFERQARLTPAAVAVTAGGERLTYQELDRRASTLAAYLVHLGVQAGDVVGMRLERSLDLVIAVVAIVKAGAAYLPLDPTYPPDRVRFIVRDAGARIVLTHGDLGAIFDEPALRIIHVDREAASIDERPAAGARRVPPESLAYIIYTSGSTGRPKGVQVTHANVVRLFDATKDLYGFRESDVWTLFHSIAFDFSVWELWGALLHGARLVVVPYVLSRSPEEFYELVVSERVTVLNQTPSAFSQFMQVDAARREALSLRYVIFGGEALEVSSLSPWFERNGDSVPLLVNMYGITETTVHVTYRILRSSDVRGGSVVGRAIPDLGVRILDSRGLPVPIGVPGEMHVSGAGLAWGYRCRPDLTAERFVPDPQALRGGGRMYRSGDAARRLANGDIEYLGRLDQQVKIRGFRIELGEIESTLAEQPGVLHCAVVAREDLPGPRRLVAYVVGDAKISALSAALRLRLPEYMMPSAFVLLASLPLTGNGKLDRKALPAPQAEAGAEAYAAPTTAVQKTMCAIAEELLGVPRVGIHDNFFELGGHSLLATQFVSRVRSLLRVDMSVRHIFENPTIAQQEVALFGSSLDEGEI